MPGTLVLTFDNLGEASELERGERPTRPHPSVIDALPRLLDELDARSLRATFFVEAINCELYPNAVRSISTRGHELGHHGWRHEQWDGLPAPREREILHKGVNAFAGLGLRVHGFRPPGGTLTARSASLLREAGFHYCSPHGDTFARHHGLGYVPFEWELVDAYHLMDRFASVRQRRGDPARSMDPPALGRRFAAQIDEVAAGGGPRTFVLHPFLMLDQRWFDCVCSLLDRACSRRLPVLTAGQAACALK